MKQKHELAQEDYMQGMKYKEIAEKHDVSVNTVKSWKTRYKWDRKGVHTKEEKVRTQKKIGAPFGSKNALGNKGGNGAPKGNKHAVGHGAPRGNKNAETHGFFSKHFPEEVAELAAEIMEKPQLEMIWESIVIQYTAIIRAQRLMFVKDQEDMTKELKRTKEGYSDYGSSSEEEFEIQFAWDKHATFINAQSRAMTTLSQLIEKFDKLANADDERRSKMNLMQAQIDKLKADTNKEDKDVLKVQIIDDVPQDDDNV